MPEEVAFAKMETAQKERVVAMVRRFGGFTADAILDPQMHLFQQESVEGFIGYRSAGKAFVVFGDPICSLEDKIPLAKAFYSFASKQGKEVIYVAASHLFAHGVVKLLGGALIELASEIIFDPLCNPRKESGPLGSLVRRKVKKAEDSGVQVHEYLIREPYLDRAIEEVATLWLASRRGPQVHISNVYLFENCTGKRWFYAQEGETIIGVVLLNELKEHKGYLINHLMVTPEAPNGTSEYLITFVLEILAKEGCRFATVGVVPKNEIGEVVGLSRFFKWCIHKSLQFVKKITPIDGLYTFWKKFHPQSQPGYLVFSRNKLGILEATALKRAFTGNQGKGKNGRSSRKIYR